MKVIFGGIVALLMIGMATVNANPPKKVVQQSQAPLFVKQRRFVEDNGYPVQAIAVDVAGAQYPYIYSRHPVADATYEESIQKQLADHEARIASLERRIEDLIRILSGDGEGVGGVDGEDSGGNVDNLGYAFESIVKENCKTCHTKKNPSGKLVLLNDNDKLWTKKVDGPEPRDLTAREWHKLSRYVEIGKMPKGDKKLNNEQKDTVDEYVDKQLEKLEGDINENS